MCSTRVLKNEATLARYAVDAKPLRRSYFDARLSRRMTKAILFKINTSNLSPEWQEKMISILFLKPHSAMLESLRPAID